MRSGLRPIPFPNGFVCHSTSPRGKVFFLSFSFFFRFLPSIFFLSLSLSYYCRSFFTSLSVCYFSLSVCLFLSAPLLFISLYLSSFSVFASYLSVSSFSLYLLFLFSSRSIYSISLYLSVCLIFLSLYSSTLPSLRSFPLSSPSLFLSPFFSSFFLLFSF